MLNKLQLAQRWGKMTLKRDWNREKQNGSHEIHPIPLNKIGGNVNYFSDYGNQSETSKKM